LQYQDRHPDAKQQDSSVAVMLANGLAHQPAYLIRCIPTEQRYDPIGGTIDQPVRHHAGEHAPCRAVGGYQFRIATWRAVTSPIKPPAIKPVRNQAKHSSGMPNIPHLYTNLS
jgi:hypothetical protein